MSNYGTSPAQVRENSKLEYQIQEARAIREKVSGLRDRLDVLCSKVSGGGQATPKETHGAPHATGLINDLQCAHDEINSELAKLAEVIDNLQIYI